MSSRLVRMCMYGLGLLTILATTGIGLLASSLGAGNRRRNPDDGARAPDGRVLDS